MEFMAQQSLQYSQALAKSSEAVDKMDDKGGTVDMKSVGNLSHSNPPKPLFQFGSRNCKITLVPATAGTHVS